MATFDEHGMREAAAQKIERLKRERAELRNEVVALRMRGDRLEAENGRLRTLLRRCRAPLENVWESKTSSDGIESLAQPHARLIVDIRKALGDWNKDE